MSYYVELETGDYYEFSTHEDAEEAVIYLTEHGVDIADYGPCGEGPFYCD